MTSKLRKYLVLTVCVLATIFLILSMVAVATNDRTFAIAGMLGIVFYFLVFPVIIDKIDDHL